VNWRPSKFLGSHAEVVGKLLRHVRELYRAIGFPEPPAPAVFELVDELQGLARLTLQPQAAAALVRTVRAPAML
jgi:hypothetical protein